MIKKKKKKILLTVIILLCVWITIGVTDYLRVKSGHLPIFCINREENFRYYGLGYYYDIYNHPVTGNFEYAFTFFGQTVTSTFTD